MTLLLTAAIAFWLAGVAQSVSGFGAALVAVPILALTAGPAHAVVSVTLVSLVLSGWAARRERAHIDRPTARAFTITGVIGMPLGLVLLQRAGDQVLQVLMSVTVIGALIVVAARVRVPAGRLTTSVTGILGGALLTSTGMNGPPIILGIFARRLDPRRFRGTLQVVFACQDLAAAIGFAAVARIDLAILATTAIGVAASPMGWLTGDRLFHKIPAHAFHRVVAIGLALSALTLLAAPLLPF